MPNRMRLDDFLTTGKEFTPEFGDQTLFELGHNLTNLGAQRIEVELDGEGRSTATLHVKLGDCIPIDMISVIASEAPSVCKVVDGNWLVLGWR